MGGSAEGLRGAFGKGLGGITMSSIPSSSEIGAGNWSGESRDFGAWSPDREIPGAASAGQQAAGLVRMVESEIIPRLMLAHRNAPPTTVPPVDPDSLLGPRTIETFARMVVSKDSDSLITFVGQLLQAGATLEAVYTQLLVPAARRLGDYWDEDSASFTDVTVGLGRLQQVVRAMGWKSPGTDGATRFSRSAFFAPGPNEQHVFGLFIVEDFFRRAGWSTWVETSTHLPDMIDTVRSHWFDMFGMSVNADTHLDEVTSAIRAIKAASRNPNIFVMVGGRLFLEQPDLVSVVAADATAASGSEALLVANHALLIADNGVSALTPGA